MLLKEGQSNITWIHEIGETGDGNNDEKELERGRF